MVRPRHLIAVSAAVLVASCLVAFGSVLVARTIVTNVEAVAAQATIPKTLPVSADRVDAVSLVVVGDVMLDRTVAARIKAAKDDLYPFLKVFLDGRFSDADLQLMNLEGPLTDRRRPPEKSIDFLFDPRLLKALKAAGFDAASQANNHALDQGRAGADDSRKRLLAAGFLTFGDEVRDDAVAIATTTVRGRRLAFVGLNSASDRIDDEAANATMKRARAAADTLIVFMHWGVEYRSRPTKDQEARARWLIDRGADIVIGAHPHWVQSIRVYKGKPILYSLGNFVFDQDWSEATKEGLAVKLFISDAELLIDLHPVRIDKSQPRFVEGAARDKRLRDLASISDASLTNQILQGKLSFASGQ